MSSIAMQGGATGSGTVTLLAPSTSTNRTINLPDSNGTILTTATAGVPVNGPAFSAYQSSAQTLSSNTSTKILFQTEEFDTASAFDSTTNYRFTPLVAGYYQVTGGISVGATQSPVTIVFYKNGSAFKYVNQMGTSGSGFGSALIYLNGTTDYVELYGNLAIGQVLGAGASFTYFQAAMIRSAT